MSAGLRRFLAIVAVSAMPFALSGCFIFHLGLNDNGGIVYVQADVHTTGDCNPRPNGLGGVYLECTYAEGIFSGATEYTADGEIDHIDIYNTDTFDFIDPIVFQVPAASGGFSGTFDNGASTHGALKLTAGLKTLPVDVSSYIAAEPGMQLVVAEFPANTPFGNYNLALQFSGSPDTIKMIATGKVHVGGKDYYPPMLPCEVDFAKVPALSIPVSAMPVTPPLVDYEAALKPCKGKQYRYPVDPPLPGSVDVIEFYNASLDHYFMTWLPDEIAKLDAGDVIKGWRRTGRFFTAFPATQPGTSPVCRFYIPPAFGDSHFYGRGTAECDATRQKYPGFVLEDAEFMHVMLPNAATGFCPPKTTEIYRVFSNRPDANHRYMVDRDLRDQMVAAGWLAEGDGDELVVMCGVRLY